MAALPTCPNFAKKRGCASSKLRIIGEGDDFWTFHCDTCSLDWVVSKPASTERAKFRKAEETLRQQAERRRAHEKRPIYYT